MSPNSQVRGFDFSVPHQFLKCLWSTHFGPRPTPAIHKQFWQRDVAIVNRWHADVFDLNGGERGAIAVHEMIAGLARGKHPEGHTPVDFPQEWLHIFHEAFEAGLISATTWGKAARLSFVSSDSPVDTAGRSNERALMALRATKPGTLMDATERALWRSLPSTVTLYRGACASSFDQAMRGLSWTPDPHLAVSYAHVRERELHLSSDDAYVWPWLIEAQVPKAAILAVVIIKCAKQIELIVDYEKLSPGMLKALGTLDTPEAIADRIAQAREAASRPLAA